MTGHKANASELIAEARKRLETPGTITVVGVTLIRGLLEQAELEIAQIEEFKRPRRVRRKEAAS